MTNPSISSVNCKAVLVSFVNPYFFQQIQIHPHFVFDVKKADTKSFLKWRVKFWENVELRVILEVALSGLTCLIEGPSQGLLLLDFATLPKVLLQAKANLLFSHRLNSRLTFWQGRKMCSMRENKDVPGRGTLHQVAGVALNFIDEVFWELQRYGICCVTAT